MHFKTRTILFLIAVFGLSFPLMAQETQTTLFDTSQIDRSDYYPGDINYNILIASYKGYPSEVLSFLNQGADVDYKSAAGYTPLMYAVGSEQILVVQVLLINEADPDIQARDGSTALIMAVKQNAAAIAEELIRRGANMNLHDRMGATALHYAAAWNLYTMADLLLYYGMPADTPTEQGTSPLQAAVWAGNYDVANLFLSYGANVNYRDEEGYTPLILASQNNDTAMMRLLLENGAEPALKNQYGYDPLLTAIKFGYTETFEYLLNENDQWNYPEKNTPDPFNVARAYGRTDLMKELKQYGMEGDKGIRFDRLSLSFQSLLSVEDYIPGIRIGTSEPQLLIDLGLVFYSRPWRKRVTVEESENTYSIFRSQRSLVGVSLLKQFKIYERPLRSSAYLDIGIDEYLTFGPEYKGSIRSPESQMVFVPSTGISFKKNRISYGGKMSYMNFSDNLSSPWYLNLHFSYSLYYDNYRAPDKILKWY